MSFGFGGYGVLASFVKIEISSFEASSNDNGCAVNDVAKKAIPNVKANKKLNLLVIGFKFKNLI